MRKILLILGLAVLAVAFVACAGGQEPAQEAATPETVVETEIVEKEVTQVVRETEVVEKEVVVTATPEPGAEETLVTYTEAETSDIPSLDPQLAEDVISINYIENLFVHLTNYDLQTQEIVPEAATDWTVSEDGTVYTFTLRNDIPWVKYNPVTGETTQEMRPPAEEDGEPTEAFVTAQDFVYGIKRACDPNLGSYYASVFAPIIVGCEAALNAEDPSDEAALQELKDQIGVSAPDESTLVIELEFAAAYFEQMTPMWTITATPQWAIEEHGDNWTEAGNIVTNGRFVLAEWVHGTRFQVQRNPMIPEDMQGEGNVERHVANVVPDVSTEYSLWLNNEVDHANIPDAELQAHLDEYPEETIQVPDLAVFYIAFAHDKEPFDDAQVRRAFSAAFDRETFIQDVRQGQGQPMRHFAPPGIFGAPPIDEVGVGYDPEFAQQQLEAAGYPNCEGFPQVTLLGYSGEETLNWIEFAQAQWEENLGCGSDLIQIEQQPFAELLAATAPDQPTEERPHMWTLGWGPDYPDENNWVGDVLWCEGTSLRIQRPCTEEDELIVQAREEQDPEVRRELYRQIEQGFFGEEGTMPFAPLYLRIAFVAQHDWVERDVSILGGEQFYNWSIDADAKAQATGQ